MTQYTDEEIARQLEELLNVITKGTDSAKDVLQQAQQIKKEVSECIERTQEEVEQRLVEVRELSSQTVENSRTVTERIQEIEENANHILQMRSLLQQLHQEVMLAVSEIGGQQGLEQLRKDSQEVQRRINEIQELISTAQSTLVTQAQVQIQLQEKQVLNQLQTLVAEVLTPLGGQAGLETLRQELQQGREVLGEIQHIDQQLHSNIATSLAQVQETVQAHSAMQEMVSQLETVRSEVSDLAKQVRLDREAIKHPENQNSQLAIALRREMEQQQRELQKLRTQINKQHRLQNWLLGIVFTCVLTALTLTLIK
ncbi:MAG: hypothetical protein SAK29_06980 [Scytonema sp. PMC 1069.18]|nr:hypothetical protein [Scytonema sp. PMC 1069.18]MEC4883147.1 hypothetical protein [Scytonema sp. PMC 1070.18]